MFKAAIFDMDGLLIDSEPFWRSAEKDIFESVGIIVTEEHTRLTSQMTTKEATEYWYSIRPWSHKSLTEIEENEIREVAQLIEKNGVIMPGVEKTLFFLKQKNYKIGLATNSPDFLLKKVINKLKIEPFFDATSSSEFEVKGKPDPDVYLTTAKKLQVDPIQCIVFEDSSSGIRAALTAGMKVIAVPNRIKFHDPRFDIANLKIDCLESFCEEHIQLIRE